MKTHINDGSGGPRCHMAPPKFPDQMLAMYSPTLDHVYCKAITGDKFRVDDKVVCKTCLKSARAAHHGSLKAFKEWEKHKPRLLTKDMIRNL